MLPYLVKMFGKVDMQIENSRVAFYIPSLIGGGAERVMVNLANEFAKKHIKVALVVNVNKVGKYDVPDGVELFVLNANKTTEAIRPLVRFMREWRPTHMLSALTYANFTAVIASFALPGLNLYISEHISVRHWRMQDRDSKNRGWTWQFLTRILVFLLYPFASGCVAVSTGVKKEFCQLSPLTASKWMVIGNPVALPSRRRGGMIMPGEYMLAAGALAYQKGYEFLIRALPLVLRHHADIRLIIIGEGPERSVLEQLAETLGVRERLVMPGFVRNVADFYQSARIFVHPSLVEGFGNVIVEALSYGVPVVATDCPHGPREILNDGEFGELVPPMDVDALSSAILKVLRLPVQVEILKRRAMEYEPSTIGCKYVKYMIGRAVS